MTTFAPSHWATAMLGDILTLINGRAYKQEEMLMEGTPILRIQNLNGGSKWFYSNLNLASDKYCDSGDLLYAWSATFGPYIYTGQRAIFHYHIWNVISSEAIHKKFAFYELMRVTADIKRAAHGVAMPHVTKGGMEAWEIRLPPLSEQTRIADKLDALLARVDAARGRLDRVPALLKRFRQSVLAAATNGELTEEWRAGKKLDWDEADVQSVAQVGTGSTPLRANKTFYAERGTPWITSAATSERFVVSAEEFVTADAIKSHRLKVYPAGTLLVAMYGEGKTRGQVTELAIPATINQACAAIQVDEGKADRRYVRLALEANYYAMRDLAEGGNQPNLNLSKVKEFPFLMPSLDEQAEIVRRVEALFALADRVQAQYEAARARVDKLTPALLAKAFRGELVPQDPNDEPASALLERLRASKASAPKAAKRGRGASVSIRKGRKSN